MTKNQREFQKELRNLKRRIKAAKKRGFNIPKDTLPETPKRVTKQKIEELKKLRGEYLERKADSFIDPVTGQKYSAKEGIKIQNERRVQKGRSTVAKNKILKEIRKGKLTDREFRNLIKDLNTDDLREVTAEIYNIKKPEEPKPEEPKPEEPKSEEPKSEEPKPKEPKWSDAFFGEPTESEEDESEAPGVSDPTNEKNNVLDATREKISEWTPDANWTDSLKQVKEENRNLLDAMLNSAIAAYGEKAVAEQLKRNAGRVDYLTERILYASGDKAIENSANLSEFADILKGAEELTIAERAEIDDIEYDSWGE